ncbi:hypothetical protein [Algoriphagus litoralis]|uniref:hypothetical protein n=1 Tax=Algoriphagus litoralis TaxID=2202829 RepID=UPI000DBA71C6|nr:hypothetical protein [Algoriphagus litoralis]
MKDFLDYLKWKPTWIGILVGSVGYILFVQAYVYPTLTFDFSVIYEWSAWRNLLIWQTCMTIASYFTFGKPNRKVWAKEKPQSPEVS